MSSLRDYLTEKRAAIAARRQAVPPETPPAKLTASVTAEGRSGIRRIRMRDFQILQDSGPDLAGYNLGPAAAEIQIGVLGACITHVFLLIAAERGIELDGIRVDVTCEQEPASARTGFGYIPGVPSAIAYTAHIDSPATADVIAELHTAVEAACPLYNLLTNPQVITGSVSLNGTGR
jgi:uncharacterized OsmC-like protein